MSIKLEVSSAALGNFEPELNIVLDEFYHPWIELSKIPMIKKVEGEIALESLKALRHEAHQAICKIEAVRGYHG
jgi:argonaute-like protein implicated in RNA metabolism and viral defense